MNGWYSSSVDRCHQAGMRERVRQMMMLSSPGQINGGGVEQGSFVSSSPFPRAELELELVGLLALVSCVLRAVGGRHVICRRHSSDYARSTTQSGVKQ